jgi:DNA-binding CsgD family transcriptional regulator/tetratricopeptide (TPR) repeat protein
VEEIVPEGVAPSAVGTSGSATQLLERSHELSALGGWLAAVAGGSRGRLVLVGGEAGVGKTLLLRRFCDDNRGSAPSVWGACEALFTPRPLGPFLDLAEVTGGELAELVAGDSRSHELVAALVRELRRRPAIVVLEDVHWADEASLDVLSLLGRRIESAPALVLASYRDDELDHKHPLRIVLGDLATCEAVERLRLEPLSPGAVARLSEPHGVDAEELYRTTGGNPFFVTEVLAAHGARIPATVRDAVLSRAARLSPAARELLEAVSIAPQKAEPWLLEALTGDRPDSLEECLGSGMLTAEPGGVAFRHELGRLAIEQALAPNRAIALHRKALAALADPAAGVLDPARLAHHAEAADDVEAVQRHAPRAAERAARLGAHREAASQYARALRFGEALPAETRAGLLERRAYECYLTGELEEAIAAQERALAHRRTLDDRRAEGDCMRSLSRLYRFFGRTKDAAEVGREAVARLEEFPPGRELAMAYVNLGHHHTLQEDVDEAIAWSQKALELGKRLDDRQVLVYGLTNLGAVEVFTDASQAPAALERSLDLALRAGLEDEAARVYLNLVWWPLRQKRYDLIDRYLEAGLKYCAEHDLDLWRLFFIACRARFELDRGRWAEAADTAVLAVRDYRTFPVPRVFALTVLALVRARRGDSDVWPLLEEALALAEPTGELERIGWVAMARAEAAWLEGTHDAVAEATEAALELALRRRAAWVVGELACWRRRAGIQERSPPGAAQPFALQLAGECRQAAELWTKLDCPYEAALALGDSEDEDELRQALGELQALGAAPGAAIVARRLRERGARGLPRGPRPSTRQNPANLTPRELQVLALVAEGLRNAQIAERLFLSEKTVGHHVSAILRKLDVRTRGEASAEAVRLGLAAQDR